MENVGLWIIETRGHPVHRPYLIALSMVLAVAASAGAQPAAAQDNWFAAQWTPAPVRAAPSHWRTIVIPVQPTPDRGGLVPAAMMHRPAALKPLTGYAHEMSGLASFYNEGQETSSGEPFDKRALTAAHKTLPLGTRVRVTNLANGKSTIVRINDRGPFKPGRIIDLSEAAAEQLAMTGAGIARVSLDVVR